MKKHLQLILSLLCVLTLVFGTTAATLAEEETETRVISIKWEDQNNYNGYRPAKVNATLGTQTIELTAEKGWTGEVSVPVSTGNDWVVDVPEHYQRAGMVKGTTTVVTLKNYVAPSVSVKAQIVWEDNHNAKGIRPNTAKLVLYADGQLYGKPKDASASVSWTDLPACKPGSDTPIKYTVGAQKDPEGYTSSVSGDTVTFTLNTVNVTISASISGYPEGVDVSGLRLVVDGADPDMPRTLTWGDFAGGSYTFENVLPGSYLVRDINADTLVKAYNESQKGQPDGVFYIMDKDNTKVCDAAYIASGSGTLEWKYTYKKATSYEEYEGYDKEEFESYDPWKNVGSLTFMILGPDEDKMPMTLTLADFDKIDDNLYRYDKLDNLKPGVYTVVEKNAERLVKYYTLTSDSKTALKIDVKADGSTTARLENYYVPAPTPEPEAEFVEVPVTKTWNDSGDKDGNRPDSITVRLYADGVEVASHVLTAAEGWKYTFVNLPRYQDDNKTEIVYTVNEDDVPMYTKEIQGYNLVNYYLPEVTKRTVAKVWDDNDDKQKLRPTSIVMTLLLVKDSKTKETVATVTLNKANGWTATVYNLPTTVDGKKAVYAWEEQAVLGYILLETKEQNGTVTFINQPWERPDEPPKGGKPKTRGEETTTLDDYDTPLGVTVIINHVGDCFD